MLQQQSDLVVEAQLIATIHESIALFQYDNARFLGERLVALHTSEANQQLLASCYLHSNQAYRAYHLLKGHSSQRSRYLLAVSCVQLQRYPEARDALTKMGDAEIPFGAAGLHLLGKVCRLAGRLPEAKDYYCRALRLNPLLWPAYEELCAVGGDEEAAELCSVAASPTKPGSGGDTGGPASPTTSSHISTVAAMAPTPVRQPGNTFHHVAVQAQQAGRQGHQAQQPGAGLALLADQLLVRTASQQHQPGGPAGSSAAAAAAAAGLLPPGATPTFAAGPSPGMATFAPGAAPQAQVPGAPSHGAAAGAHAGLPFAFQTPMQGATPSASPGLAPTALFGATPTPLAFPTFGGWAQHSQPAQPAQTAGGQGPGGAAPPSAAPGGLFRFGQGGGAAGAAGPSAPLYVTPAPGGIGSQPPAPPFKGAAQLGASEVPFPGFSSGPASSSGGRAAHAQPGGQPHTQQQQQRNGRMMDEGKVRKVSNRLFSDPGSSVRRSQRLAAMNTGHGRAGHHGPASAVGAAPANSVQGQAKSGQASYIEGDSQNMPDPRHPPPAPTMEQLLPDAKLGPGAATGATQQAGRGMPLGAVLGADVAFVGPAVGGQASAHPAMLALGPPGYVSPEGRAGALQLLAPIFEACRHLAAFRCVDAVKALGRLPMGQHRTAWVQCALGRAHFERSDYKKAVLAFESARQLDRCRLEGMDLLSTALWHTRQHYQLSALAQELVATDRLAPQTWIAVGNLFSSQKEHEAAVEFFLRAAQVEPSHTYAYTLAGHEHYANEDYDKAAGCYRAANKLDPRHYNALYGLGQLLYRQEKYDQALSHFRMAAAVNPRSSVLACYVGMSAAKMGQAQIALEKLQEAIELDGANPLARYEKAAVLASMDRVAEALTELDALQRLAPGEASVPFQIGKMYKRLNNLTAAQQAFELALACSPNNNAEAATIKNAIEKLGLSDEEEEEEM